MILILNFFNTSHTNGTRLRTLAVNHALLCVNCMLVWDNSVAFLVTQAVLRQTGKMTRAMVKSHAGGCLGIPRSGISMKGLPAWRATIAQGPTHILQAHIAQHNSSDNNLPHLHNSEFDLIFSCPKCSASRSVENCSLLVRSGWGHILCKACRTTTRSMTWLCVCGLPWHKCPEHSRLIRGGGDEDAVLPDQIVPI